MTDVDPYSLRPRIEGKQAKEKDLNVERKQIERSEAVAQGLNSPQGETLVQFIRMKIHQRIDEMASKDPELCVLIELLKNMGVTIKIGEEASKRILKNTVDK